MIKNNGHCKYEQAIDAYEFRNFNVPLTPICNGQGSDDKQIYLACPSCGEVFILK